MSLVYILCMTPHQIMMYLSQIFNGYEAACWLKKERLCFSGATAAELMKEGRLKEVGSLLEEELKYKKFEARRKIARKARGQVRK